MAAVLEDASHCISFAKHFQDWTTEQMRSTTISTIYLEAVHQLFRSSANVKPKSLGRSGTGNSLSQAGKSNIKSESVLLIFSHGVQRRSFVARATADASMDLNMLIILLAWRLDSSTLSPLTI
jgi:hypothetical protein